MGCVIGKPKLTDEELDFIARSTNQSRDIVEKQYRNFHAKNPGANLSKWDFRNKNSVHQIMNPRRVPITVQRTAVSTNLIVFTKRSNFTMLFYHVKMLGSSSP